MPSLLELFKNHQRAGVYRSTIDTRELTAAGATAGLQVIRIDLRRCRGKADLLTALAKALKFPSHFGHNWDALRDCLAELPGGNGSGWLILMANGKTFAERCAEDFATLTETLRDAVESWRAEDVGFWVVVQDQPGWELDLPLLVPSHDG